MGEEIVSVEAYGRTREEALERLLRELKATADEVEVEVLREARDFLILRGVLKRRKKSIQEIENLLKAIVQVLAPEGEIRLSEVTDELVYFNIFGEQLGGLIGRKGNTLRAIQCLISESFSRMQENRKIVVDVGFYQKKRWHQLKKEVHQAIEIVRTTGKEIVLEPMDWEERTWVYEYVKQFPDMDTRTIGKETSRQIILFRREK